MIRDIFLKHSHSFTMEDREKCLPVVMQINHLADMACTEGLLSLDQEIRDESKSYSVFLRYGIELVIDGRDPTFIESFLENLILFENHTGSELLKKLIIVQGVLMLQQGEKPYVMKQYMLSFLGEKLMKQMSEDEVTSYEKYFTLLDAIKDKITFPECIGFANYIKFLSGRMGGSFQCSIFNDNIYQLNWALRGCGSDVIRMIVQNMTLTEAIYILERRLDADGEQDADEKHLAYIIDAQKQWMNYLKKLEKNGMIVLPEYEESISF